MKLSIERAVLLKSLGHVQSVVERRNTIPILANVKLTAADERLALNATDMDIDIVESAPAAVKAKGATTAPAHTLYEIARKLPEGSEVEIESNGEGKLTVRAGRSRFQLACLPTEEFPAIGGGTYAHTFALAAADLRGIVERTRFAISNEETRYYLNGIYLHAAKRDKTQVLRAVATDGHRLASVEVPLPKGAAGMPGVIVPRKTVTELHKLIEEGAGDVEIGVSEAKIRFAFNEAELTSKLIDGTFPDYERVIPTGNDKELEVARLAFTEAVDRVSAISSEKSRAVKLKLGKNMVELSATSAENGSASEEIEVAYKGPSIEIGFNARYLLDITQQMTGETVRLTMADAASPTVLRDAGDASGLYVLMPMRV
ncbi:MAG: DNA polymerase III subunit beta [Alphaproteobacteria bacterium]|nr:DNA polymerase III subunit beta [Alphaproteobacteria bacterium]